MSTNKIRNVKAFVSSYLGSESGKAALNRKPIVINKAPKGKKPQWEPVWRNPAMALAFQSAITTN